MPNAYDQAQQYDLGSYDPPGFPIGPTLQYLVAFNNGPFDDPALITTVASPAGSLGAHNVWTDITRWVTNDTGQRGRQQELTAFQAGTREIHLRNEDGRFTPWNTSSPYTGLVQPKKPVQVRAIWSGVTYTRFTGQVDSWATEWPDAAQQTVTLHATDVFRVFNTANVTSTGYESQVLNDGAGGYWIFSDPVGSTSLLDSATNTIDARPQNAVYTLGNAGALLASPGTSLTFAQNTSFTHSTINLPQVFPNGTTALTIEFWFNASAQGSEDPVVAVETAPFTTSGTQYAFALVANGDQFASTTWDAVPPDSIGLTDFAGNVISATFPTYGAWHHLVGTATIGSGMSLYLDGVLVASTATPPAASATTTVNNMWCHIVGASLTMGAQHLAEYLSALSPTQVAKHYSVATFPQQSPNARIGAILDAVAWSSTARNLDTNTSATVQAVTSPLTSTSSLSHMQSVEATEGGALFMGTDGKVNFRSRQNLFSGATYTTSQMTFGDNTAGGDIPYLAGPRNSRDDIFLYNEAVATRTGGKTQRTTSATSITNYGRSTWTPPSTLDGISDAEVLSLAQYVVNKYATPVDRLQSITIDLLSVASSFPSLVPTLMTLELLTRVTVERASMPGGGTAFSQQANVGQIAETINPNQWFITLQLAVADPPWWILGTSQLGSTTTLAW